MARRRRIKKRRDKIFVLICILALLLSIGISAFISDVTGTFNLNLFTILTIVFVVLFAAAFIVLSIPAVKGKIGEARVNKILKRLVKRHGGQIVYDVTIPGENGKTSQIDHIYVSNYGVYVIETKNYAGRIYGKDGQREWTQVLAYGNTKNKLYNPVMQNQTHIYRLKQAISANVPLFSVIVFVKANLDYIESDYVYSLYGLKHLLDDEKKRIDDETMNSVFNEIMECKLNPTKTNKEHVQEIKQMQKDIKNNICPRCGGNLVLRKGKDGSQFYGCENYPKCKFTKKA